MLALAMDLPIQIADIQLAFAKAYAESGDAVAAAKIVLNQLDEAQGTLKTAGDAIRDFVLKGNPEADLPVADEEENRLSISERETVNSQIDKTVASNPDITANEMISIIEAETAIKLRERFENPAAFIGSNIKRAKTRLQPHTSPAADGIAET